MQCNNVLCGWWKTIYFIVTLTVLLKMYKCLFGNLLVAQTTVNKIQVNNIKIIWSI